MRLPLLCALIFAVLAGGMTTTASDLSRPLGDPQLERRPCARWASTGSSRATTTRTPSSPWSTARRARRPGERLLVSSASSRAHLMERSGSELEVPDDGWLFAGSALLLEPRAAYELRLTLEDPDGGKATRTLRASTRSEPLVSTTARAAMSCPAREAAPRPARRDDDSSLPRRPTAGPSMARRRPTPN